MPPELRAVKERQAELRKQQAQNYKGTDLDALGNSLGGNGNLNDLLLPGHDEFEEGSLLAKPKQRIKSEDELHAEAMTNFKELLREKKVNASVKWEQAQKQLANEERWKAIKQISEKKRLFLDFISEVKQRER